VRLNYSHDAKVRKKDSYRYSKENRSYPFVSSSFSFVPQKLLSGSVFQFQRTLPTRNSAILQDIEKWPTISKENLYPFVPSSFLFVSFTNEILCGTNRCDTNKIQTNYINFL